MYVDSIPPSRPQPYPQVVILGVGQGLDVAVTSQRLHFTKWIPPMSVPAWRRYRPARCGSWGGSDWVDGLGSRGETVAQPIDQYLIFGECPSRTVGPSR